MSNFRNLNVNNVGHETISLINEFSHQILNNVCEFVQPVVHQINPNIFKLIENFFEILKEKNWLNSFIFWELEFFKLIGYNLELKNLVKEEIVDNKKIYFVLSNQEKKIVPNFLVENNSNEINKKTLLTALKLTSDYLDKTILRPNNISQPKSRNDLINLIKK